MIRCSRLGLALAASVASLVSVQAYVVRGPSWPSGTIVMHLQLGTSPSLTDGCSSWGCSAEGALAGWNLYLNRSLFGVVHESTAPIGDQNRITNVFFGDDFFGQPWGTDTLAITQSRWIGAQYIEGDVGFNRTKQWDSYRGSRRTRAGQPLHDFRRVALHEFGHVLGLLHPDEYGQERDAMMNSSISDIDALQFDDILGAYALYLGSITGGALDFPPRDQTFDFRAQLEAKYRNQLGRAPGPSYTDVEGSVVWIQEYLRYRVTGCRNDQAGARIVWQIAGYGVQPACGPVPRGVSFPPRNESLGFRRELEGLYRDTLNRMPVLTAVDLEGDVVWIQEYIRYRLSGCGHATATERVMRQVDGFGVQPACS